MQILLVDDDRFVLQALQQKIDWQSLNASKVFSAANMQQAQDIIREKKIDLLISDIEMPKGSGLELLAWLRGNGNLLPTIFLTNYADFNYAQKAIELQSFEYYLKPIDYEKLTLIIKKALQKVHQQQLEQSEFENSRQPMLRHLFFQRALSKPRLGKMTELINLNEFSSLTFNDATAYALTVVTMFPYMLQLEPLQLKQESDLTKKLQASIQTVQLNYPEINNTFSFRREETMDSFLLVMSFTDEKKINPTLINSFLSQLKENLQHTHGLTSLMIGQQVTQFKQLELTTIQLYKQVDLFVRSRQHNGSITNFWQSRADATPVTSSFEKLLATYKWETCLAFIEDNIQTQSLHKQVESRYLEALKFDLMQTLHSFLQQREILAHQLLQTDEHQFLSSRYLNSIESFLDYFKYCIKTSLTFIEWSHSQKSVATIVKEYIDEHYAQDINRSTIADVVFLSPDHVARIFKKEMSISLGSYIIDTRLNAAKKLLTTTTLPINVIATNVGYDNYSYFTKLFKKNCQHTPIDYRNLYSE